MKTILRPVSAMDTYTVAQTVGDGKWHVVGASDITADMVDSPEVLKVKVIEIISITTFLDQHDLLDVGYMESGDVLRDWCSAYGAHYFARPREEFFIRTAVEEAANQGYPKVVVEDLS